MAASAIVVILIAVSEAQTPLADAMIGALGEALGSDTSVIVRSSVAPSDSQALQLERDLHAIAVAHVTWVGSSRDTAVLRTHVVALDRWIERRVNFLPGDSRSERGRTLGLSIAALLLPDAEPADGRAPAPALGGAGTPITSARRVGTPSAETEARAQPDDHGDTAPGPRGPLALDIGTTGAVGVAGPATGIGGSAHAEYLVGHAIFLRGGALVRTGEVPGLAGDDTVAAFGLGATYRPIVSGVAGRSLGLGLAAEALLLRHDLSHRGADGRTVHRSRVLPGSSVIVEGTWAIGWAVEVCVGAGVEVAFGDTEVLVATQSVATVPRLRLVGQLGLRFHF